MKVCFYCKKGPKSVNNKPNSLHKTKRKAYPNLQKISSKTLNGKSVLVCTKCIRTLEK